MIPDNTEEGQVFTVPVTIEHEYYKVIYMLRDNTEDRQGFAVPFTIEHEYK